MKGNCGRNYLLLKQHQMKVLAYTVAATVVLAFFQYCSTKTKSLAPAVPASSEYFNILEYQKPDKATSDTSWPLNQPQYHVQGNDTVWYKHDTIQLNGQLYYLVEGDIRLTPSQ